MEPWNLRAFLMESGMVNPMELLKANPMDPKWELLSENVTETGREIALEQMLGKS